MMAVIIKVSRFAIVANFALKGGASMIFSKAGYGWSDGVALHCMGDKKGF